MYIIYVHQEITLLYLMHYDYNLHNNVNTTKKIVDIQI